MYRESNGPGEWIGYCRRSTDKQGLTIETQMQRLTAEAEKRGVPLRIVVETGSGKSISGRPEFRSALADLSEGKAAGLMATTLDRFARSTLDYLTIREQAEREGWSLVALNLPMPEGGTAIETAMGKAMAQIMASFAELERAMIAERTRAAMQQAKVNGKRLGGPRTERSAELAERVYGMRVEGKSYRAICRALEDSGEPTLRGGAEWRPSAVVSLLRSYECDQVAGLV